MAASRPVRTFLLIIMDVLVLVALVLVARVVVDFFGVLAAASWGKQLLKLTQPLVLPFGIKGIVTPYGGSFDANATVTILVLLGIEWALGIARGGSD